MDDIFDGVSEGNWFIEEDKKHGALLIRNSTDPKIASIATVDEEYYEDANFIANSKNYIRHLQKELKEANTKIAELRHEIQTH